MTQPEIEQLKALLETLEAGDTGAAIEWLRAAIKLTEKEKGMKDELTEAARDEARRKTWEDGAGKFINHGNATPHRAWLTGFNSGYEAAHKAHRKDRFQPMSYL
jgi:hypothetical protein